MQGFYLVKHHHKRITIRQLAESNPRITFSEVMLYFVELPTEERDPPAGGESNTPSVTK